MVALSATSYFDRTIMSIAGPSIMREFRISETAMGTVYSAFLLSYTLMMIPGGWLSDRFGARNLLALSGLGAACCTALTALCGNAEVARWIGVVPSFLLIRFLFGIFAAPLYPSCARMAANWIPASEQGRAQAFIISGAAIGAAISPIVFSRMMGAYGWRVSFCLAAAATAILTGAWFACVRDNPPGREIRSQGPIEVRGWGGLFGNRQLLTLTLAYFLLNYFEYIFFYWIYYYFGQIRHLGAAASANATTVLFVMMALMTPFGGWVSDRLVLRFGQKIGRRSVAMACMGVSAALLYLGAQDFGVFPTVALLSLALGFATASEGPFWAVVIEISGTDVGAAGGVLNMGGNLGGSLAPVLTPLLAARFGWSAGLYFGSFMVLLGVFTWLFVDPERKIEAPAG